MTRLRSPFRVVSTRSRSQAWVRRWWRSSAWPSSAPCSGFRRPRRRSSSATLSSCATGSRGCGHRSTPERVPAWRARLVAEVTIHSTPSLTRDAAGFVDAQVAAVAGRVGAGAAGPARRGDDQALRPRRGPTLLRIRRTATCSSTRATPRSTTDGVHFAGTMRLEAELDIADALDLDRALAPRRGPLAEGARVRGVPLGARRSAAPRRPRQDADRARPPRPGRHPAPATQTVCPPHARSSCTRTSTRPSTECPTVFGPTGRLEEGQRLVLFDQVKDWCADSRTKITVKPVIDLNTHLAHTGLRGPRPDPRAGHPPRPHLRLPLVHPTGSPVATSTTSSPTTPTPRRRAGPSPVRRRSDNLAALCRFHHRLKTHTAWRYRTTDNQAASSGPHLTATPIDATGTGTTAVHQAQLPDPPDIPRPRRR